MNSRQKAEKALRSCRAQLLSMCDSEAESRSEIARYKKAFPREIDYNLAQYGNVLIYYNDIANFFKECGFTSVDKWSNNKLWFCYLGYIGRAADTIKL